MKFLKTIFQSYKRILELQSEVKLLRVSNENAMKKINQLKSGHKKMKAREIVKPACKSKKK
jgi:hypothetical protein